MFPTLLERDFNLPPVDELIAEVAQVEAIQQRHASRIRELAANRRHA